MDRLRQRLSPTMLRGLALLLCLAASAEAQSGPTIAGYTLVSSARVTRTSSSFTYRAHVTNPLPHTLAGVQATVASQSAATQIIDGTVDFGDVSPAATVVSMDTFTIHHDRTVPFDPASLLWSVSVKLAGPPATLAHTAFVTLPPLPADPAHIRDEVILTRLDVFINADATAGEVNHALDQIGARIVSMASGGSGVTVQVPRQPGIEGLQALAQQLMTFPGIGLAIPGLQSRPNLLHASNDVSESRHLVPARFPAAWNASSLAVGCQRVPLVIQDQFLARPAGFNSLFPGFPNLAAAPTADPVQNEHGYHMFAVAAAPLGLSASPGTNPFSNCVEFKPIQKGGTSLLQEMQQLAAGLPSTGKSVVSYSMSLPGNCKTLNAAQEIVLTDCTPALVSQSILAPRHRAELALEWKKLTHSRWPDFLVAASASNERNDGLSGVDIYPGLGRAANASPMNVAAKADPLFAFVLDTSQWTPAQSFLAQGFPSLVPDVASMDTLRAQVRAAGMETVRADNVVVVGGLTTLTGNPREESPGFEGLAEADFSNSDPDVKAVAVDVTGVCSSAPCAGADGNSRAAPQVAGLATYLWVLSPHLRLQPASMTRRAIVDNARPTGLTTGALDAYATVLSLDPTTTPDAGTWTVRRAILDVNTGGLSQGRFDEADIAEFLSALITLDGSGGVVDPATADFSRYDLNGDGFTGGTKAERFDLDRFGSTRYGASVYQQVSTQIEGVIRQFDESNLTDFAVLCYYAYSALYEGDPDERRRLLSGLPGTQECVAGSPEVFFPSAQLEVEDVTPPLSAVTCRRIENPESSGSPRFPFGGSLQCPRSFAQISATQTAANTIIIEGTASVSAPVISSVSTASAGISFSINPEGVPPGASALTITVQLNAGWITTNSGSGPPTPSCHVTLQSSGPRGNSYRVDTGSPPVTIGVSETFDLIGFFGIGFTVQCNGSWGAAQAAGSGRIATVTFDWN